VLLHGAGDNSLDWWWVLPALARKHRVYALDLPGSPDSARPPADYSPPSSSASSPRSWTPWA
jgi:pimeloyl-ACP methyl ester carboxylesterase